MKIHVNPNISSKILFRLLDVIMHEVEGILLVR